MRVYSGMPCGRYVTLFLFKKQSHVARFSPNSKLVHFVSQITFHICGPGSRLHAARAIRSRGRGACVCVLRVVAPSTISSARDVGAADAERGADGPHCHSATVAHPGDGAHPSGRIPHGPHAKRTTITHRWRLTRTHVHLLLRDWHRG